MRKVTVCDAGAHAHSCASNSYRLSRRFDTMGMARGKLESSGRILRVRYR